MRLIKAPLSLTLQTVALVIALCSTSYADTIHVPADHATIQGAIDASTDGDTILIAAGTYAELEVDTKGKAITLSGATNADGSPAVTIDGAHLGVVLLCESGEGSDTVFENLVIKNGDNPHGGGMSISASSPTLINCTFWKNFAQSRGGAIKITGGSPTLLSCSILENAANWGGGSGIYNDGGDLTLTDCSFNLNTALGDGGGLRTSFGSVTATGCHFSGNWSYEYGGGALSSSGADLTITECTFFDNNGYAGGGAMLCYGGVVQLTDCDFTDNETNGSNGLGGGMGGGLYASSDDLTLTNCTFTGNVAPVQRGGGMFSASGDPMLTNCTFRGNSTGAQGGGLFITGGTPVLEDCQVCGNTPNQIAHNGSGSYVELGVNIISNDCPPYEDPGTTFCFGDDDGTPCPCGNPGLSTGGCLNSNNTQGYLRASGDPSLWDDSIVLSAHGLVPNLPCLFFSGTNALNGGAGVPFGDGLRCVGGAAFRLETTSSDNNGFAATTREISTSGQSSGGGINPSDEVHYQCWYREGAAGGPCGNSHNSTNGVSITWTL